MACATVCSKEQWSLGYVMHHIMYGALKISASSDALTYAGEISVTAIKATLGDQSSVKLFSPTSDVLQTEYGVRISRGRPVQQ